MFTANVYRVMIASPGDVNEERDIIEEAIHHWNAVHAAVRQIVLLPIRWEISAAPAMGDRPQGIINETLLNDCDLLIAAFWNRAGTPTGKYRSGTIEEIEEHLKAGKPAMLYFSDRPIEPSKVDTDQRKTVDDFRKSCYPRGLCGDYDSVTSFRESIN